MAADAGTTLGGKDLPGARRARRLVGPALVAAGLLALGLGVRRGTRPVPHPPGPWASTLLAVSAELGSSPETIAASWPALEGLAKQARVRHDARQEPWPTTLVATIFEEAHVERELHDGDPRFFRLADVLAQRRGNCLGLVGLYLALAERVGVTVDAVRVPGHVFIRTRETPPRNLEMLRQGEAMSDAWYQQRYGPWPATDEALGRALSVAEVEALFWYDAGGDRLAAGRLEDAAQAFRRATERAPGFAEAAASWATARQLLLPRPPFAPPGALQPQEHRP